MLQLLGSDIQLITSHLIYTYSEARDSAAGKRLAWHRDYLQAINDLGHWSIPRIVVKCTYYLTDLSEPGSGATCIVPGSNHLRHPVEFPAGNRDPLGAIEPRFRPGDCLLFENRTWHAAAPTPWTDPQGYHDGLWL